MTKFTRWSGIVHAILVKSYRKAKFGQAQEILAAYLGHRTYASLRVHDLAALQDQTKYVLTDSAIALDRASRLGIPLTADDWLKVEMALKPSGVTGDTWLVEESQMYLAARLTFEDSSDPRLHAIGESIGMPDGRSVTKTYCHSAPGTFPEELKFTVDGEVRRFNARDHLALPVVCEVVFPRVGNRFYTDGELRSVDQSGQPRKYEPEDDIPEFGYLSDSDD